MKWYLWGTLSLSLLCFASLFVCTCVWCVYSGEMGHRGGGHLAGTAEPGGVQRHLHSTRHPRLGAAAPGEEGPEGKHTFTEASVNLLISSLLTHARLCLLPGGVLRLVCSVTC